MSRGGGAGSSARRLIAPAIVVVALAITASSASATATRGEYVAQADPICASVKKPVFTALAAYFKALKRKGGLQEAVDEKRLAKQVAGPTARLFHRWASIYGIVTTQLSSIPPAPGDESRIAAWLQARGEVPLHLDAGARALKRRKVNKAQHQLKLGADASARANGAVRDFGFRNCAPPHGDIFEF